MYLADTLMYRHLIRHRKGIYSCMALKASSPLTLKANTRLLSTFAVQLKSIQNTETKRMFQ